MPANESQGSLSLAHLSLVALLQYSETSMLADERTLSALDFEAIRGQLARYTMTDRAAARLRELAPSSDLARIRGEQAATREMRALVAQGAFSLPRVVESGEAVARAARGVSLGAEELLAIGVGLRAAHAAVRRIRASDAVALQTRVSGALFLEEVAGRIGEAIGERGEVLDRASPALARIRKGVAHAYDQARARCQAILRSPAASKAVQEDIVTIRQGRFVIPVKAEFGAQIPGVVHDTSASGQTLFVEPLEALEVNNRLRTLRIEEEHEVARILAELSSLVGAHADAVENNLEVLGDIDGVLARAHLAQAMRASAPLIVDEPRVAIHEGRHPLLGERAVAQSITLDDDVHFVVISGPNMGGKTVALKMAGLFIIMAACGLQLPAAEGTAIGHFTRVGADVGDEQSIEQNASTFSAHLDRLRELLEGADAHTLVLIDEIAGGTEPAASAALAIAVLEHLLACGAHGIVTTHATELKLFAHATPGVRNASVRFDPASHRPSFELDLGAPGQSLAFPLASARGIPEPIVTRAQALLSESERDYDRALSELAEMRAQAATERDALLKERAHVRALEENARRRAEALEQQRRAFGKTADERLSRALRDFTSELERRSAERAAVRPRVTPGQSALLGHVLEEVHRDLGLRPAPAGAQELARVGVGDVVRVESLGSEGTIVDDYGETALVAIGSMKTVVSKRQLALVRTAERRVRATAHTGEATLEAAAGASAELDVRGKRYAEAEPLVDRWIDESKLVGMTRLRLIHGKGTGLLGRGLQEFLRAHHDVRAVRYGDADEGGSGVSVVELR
jgi:DNA mismatch repair protein MutS2